MLFFRTDEKWLFQVFRGKLYIALGVRQEKLKIHGRPFQTGSLVNFKSDIPM
jgi:hypothetical protein